MQSGWAYMQSGTYMKVQVWTKSRTSGLGYGVAPRFGAAVRVVTPCSVQYYCTIVNPVYFSVFLLHRITLLHLFIFRLVCYELQTGSRNPLYLAIKQINKARRRFRLMLLPNGLEERVDSCRQGVASSPTSLKFGGVLGVCTSSSTESSI